MVDVFVSYARDDRALAAGVAEFLAAAGFAVWWDRELGGGDEFTDVIERNLNAAKCVIVVWTEVSTRSMFVRDEAARAAAAGKLVPVRSADLPIGRLPVGFGAYHTLLVGERDEICRAVARVSGKHWEKPSESRAAALMRNASRFYYAHKWPVLASFALLLAAGLAWRTIFVPSEPMCEGVPVREISSSMWNNIQLNYLDNGRARAEQLLRCDADSIGGLSGMGAISFYQGDFAGAKPWFEKALAVRPNDVINTINLADTEVELGLAKDAVQKYQQVNKPGTAVRFKLARALLLSGEPEKARAMAAHVPTTFGEEGRPGKARILEAAAMVVLAANSDAAAKDHMLEQARARFIEGVDQDTVYWTGLVTGKSRNIHEPFEKVAAILAPWSRQWLTGLQQ